MDFQPAPDPHARGEFVDKILALAKRGDAEHNRCATERERRDWPRWMKIVDLETGLFFQPRSGVTSTRDWPRWARRIWSATT